MQQNALSWIPGHVVPPQELDPGCRNQEIGDNSGYTHSNAASSSDGVITLQLLDFVGNFYSLRILVMQVYCAKQRVE